jgi:Kdo2-lipid IVA lauroyltransferase/acyltransferase
MQFLLRALTRVPLSMLYAFGTLMYFVAFRMVRWRRDRTEHDVANAFPEKDPSERAIIVRQSYRMLADTLMESFWGFGASAEAIKSRVAIENTALVTEYLSSGHSLVLLTAHYGNWEWLSLAAGAHFGITIDVVYQPQRVASFDSFLREARGRFGSRFIPRKEFIFDLMSRADKSRIYALIADQTPKGKDPRQWIHFLNQETPFFTGAGKIAQFLDAPVLYVSMRRLRRGYYSIRLTEIGTPPYGDGTDTIIVERYASSLERDIRDSPSDWLWQQNKWKYGKEQAD